MTTTEQYFRLVQTSKTSWVAVPIHHEADGIDGQTRESKSTELRGNAPALGPLFEDTVVTRVPFPERFPRLTIALIALALIAVTVTEEIDFLRGAGYHWY